VFVDEREGNSTQGEKLPNYSSAGGFGTVTAIMTVPKEMTGVFNGLPDGKTTRIGLISFLLL